MPFLFVVSGLVLTISAVRGTNSQLVALLKSDVTGQNNFIYWMVAILLIGALGYIPDVKPLSRAFLVLVVVVLFLKSGGVFQQFTQAIGTTQKAVSNTAQQPTVTSSPIGALGGTLGELAG